MKLEKAWYSQNMSRAATQSSAQACGYLAASNLQIHTAN